MTMTEIKITAQLSVFFEEPFWIGIYERMEGKKIEACKINPKRMQREISHQMQNPGIGTKAQQALKALQEENKTERKIRSKQKKEEEKERQFELRQQKKKEKHKGR